MTRPTLTPKRPSLMDARGRGDSREVARWLTDELRHKGAPEVRRVTSAPAASPAVTAAEPQPELASWLMQDVKPRSSMAADSLAPQAVTEPPPPTSPSSAQLQPEDLAVLPSRGRHKAPEAWRRVAVLTALLALAGALLWNVPASRDAEPPAAAASAEVPVAALPLPPPPPPTHVVEEAPQEQEEQMPAPPASEPPRVRAPAAAPPPELPEPSRARGRRAGDAVARFPDLPVPTLSRLARDEQEQVQQRQEKTRSRAVRSDEHGP